PGHSEQYSDSLLLDALLLLPAARLAPCAAGILGVRGAGGGIERVWLLRHPSFAVHTRRVRALPARRPPGPGQSLPGRFRTAGPWLRRGFRTSAGLLRGAPRPIYGPGGGDANLEPHTHELAGPPTHVVHPLAAH